MKKAMNLPRALFAALSVITVAIGMMPVTASAIPGFVTNASPTVTKTGFGECLHTMRWTADMGMCPDMEGDADGDGVPDSKDKCPGTPRGVKVDKDGCGLDSDGDGVPDYDDKCPGTPAGAKVDTRGCEIFKTMTIEGIYFDFDKSSLKSGAKDILDDAAAKINRNSNVRSVDVVGHTDSTGPEAYNQVLSERRANSVKSYLESKGVSNVHASGKGESSPVADNGTREGRAKNRRVEIDVKM